MYDRKLYKRILGLTEKTKKCWNWIGTKDDDGYGRIRYENTLKRVNRVMYEAVNGKFDRSLFVCHTCDNPSCVRPSHLWLGTPRQNNRDMIEKGRENKTALAKITFKQAEAIRYWHDRTFKKKDLAFIFGISRSQVNSIVLYKRWKPEVHTREAIK